MARKRNFLLGSGERLTEPVHLSPLRGDKDHPYTIDEARERLSSRLIQVSREINSLPDNTCPANEAVVALTLHPAYIAKSYFPSVLLERAGLRAVGGRSRKVVPEKWTRKDHPEQAIASEVFVAAPRSHFGLWLNSLDRWGAGDRGANDLRKLEDIRYPTVAERLRPLRSDDKEPLLEVVLHANQSYSSNYIIESFEQYLKSLDISIDLSKRIYAKGLCFLPVRVPREKVNEVAKFSFLRVAREMPSLRQLRPTSTHTSLPPTLFPCTLPKGAAINPDLRVAIFDGGVPKTPDLSKYVTLHEPPGIGDSVPEFISHGLAVTSAFLFGSLKENELPQRPFAKVDHYRVLDVDTGNDPQGELIDVLNRVTAVLQTKQHEFFGLAIGPDLPIEDDDVHVWTAKIDEYLASGNALATIAVGNGGENDQLTQNDRIQAPSDCVNALAVGACDSNEEDWSRASYSSVGPGRRPGIVKPDAVAFGGTASNPFFALSASNPGFAMPVTGTSFASPSALASAIGVRAHLGSGVRPLTIKTLLLHRCESGGHDRKEVGWGRIPASIEELITCPDDTAHVIYQGMLEPAQWLRAEIPMPDGPLPGNITISATFCFLCDIDAHNPVSYTRSGLEVIFRPHSSKRKSSKQLHADAGHFFQAKEYYLTERELRKDAHKWETTLHKSRRMKGENLQSPVFDIHYHARDDGHSASSPPSLPYALVVSVHAPQIKNLYNRIRTKYRNRLEVMRPVINIPVRRTVG
jgi:hypothetical protein